MLDGVCMWWNTRYYQGLSVCVTVKCLDCDKTKETCAHILIPHERSLILDFWQEEWLVGGRCGNGIAVLATQEALPRHCRRRLVIVVGLTGRMLSGQSTNQTMRVVVLEGAAAPCRRLAVYQGLSNDDPWDNYRWSALSVFGLYQRATRACRDMCWCTISYNLWEMRYRKVGKSASDIAILRNRYEPHIIFTFPTVPSVQFITVMFRHH